MWSNQRRIYRGLSKKYASYSFVASGLRKAEIQYMEQNFINWYGQELFDEYKSKSKNQSKFKVFKDVTDNGVWALFLAMVNLAMTLKGNPILMLPLTFEEVIFESRFIPELDKDEIPERYFDRLSDIFMDMECKFSGLDGAMADFSISSFVHPMQLCQHLNFTFRAGLPYNPLPTLVLDWTEDVNIALEFSNSSSGDSGMICSIDYDKYKNLFYDEVWPMQTHYLVDSPMGGAYYDYHNFFAKYNVNMQAQKGIVLFWPWEYTIDELQKNDLGQKLDFIALDMSCT